jgi:DNA topoisomerase-1
LATNRKKKTTSKTNKKTTLTKTQAKKKMTTRNDKEKILIIVESPAKAKTINKYLGSNYEVVASGGHIIDLPKSRMGVKLEKGFEPEYITIRGKGDILANLRLLSSFSKEVLLASDDDREGESISWHIRNAILEKKPDVKIKRIVFNEITKKAILEAIKHPNNINHYKVEAQKARRILDRIVGYELSPFLWAKIKKGLSAGRVQSVALKLICKREEEINNFVPEEYWKVQGEFKKGPSKSFKAQLTKIKNKKPEIHTKKEADDIKKILEKESYTISKYEVKERQRSPLSPYTTSKMQQDASNKLGYNGKRTMDIAQRLYMGIDLGKERTGLITYMRTDSTRVSDVALEQVRDYIDKKYGKKYLPKSKIIYKNKKGSQDAHECIRPTDVTKDPESIKKYLTKDEYKLYKLIWERFVSCQMTNAIYENTQVEIKSKNSLFKVTSSKLLFDGYTKVNLKKVELEQKFTEPNPRYTDATLVKTLEESGIGRPSTYAPTINTLITRYYIIRKQKQLIPTDIGILANKLISENFSDVINVKFTAEMEEELDKIEEDNKNWQQVLKEFYDKFEKNVKKAHQTVGSFKGVLEEETDYVCEKCGRPMVKKLGKNGYFLACSGFPECRNAKPIPLGKCPKDDCDGQIVKIKLPKKKAFYGCTNYPDCGFQTFDKPYMESSCPECDSCLFEKRSKEKGFYLKCFNESCGWEGKPSSLIEKEEIKKS